MSDASRSSLDIAQDEVPNAVIDSINTNDNNEDIFKDNNEEEHNHTLYCATNIQQVITSKFIILQVIINTVGSFIGPLLTFYLLFGVASTGPYVWNGSQLVGVVVGSLIGSPLFIFALMPVGMPEALKRGWFYAIKIDNVSPRWLFILPFLRDKSIYRYAMARHVVLGLILGIVYVPIALLIARYCFETLSTWELIFFNVLYLVCLAPPVVIFGLVGYAMEYNLTLVIDQMSNDPNPCKRLTYRSGVSIRMILCCR